MTTPSRFVAYVAPIGTPTDRDSFTPRQALAGLVVEAVNEVQALDRVAEILNERFELSIVRHRRTRSIPVLGLGSICVERVDN